MLVLSRKVGEKVYINDNITLTIVGIERGKIRLGIDAPRDVTIHRPEYKGSNAKASDKPDGTNCPDPE